MTLINSNQDRFLAAGGVLPLKHKSFASVKVLKTDDILLIHNFFYFRSSINRFLF